jgi:WD40 repeat protein/predicted Ser/Thr protein kinase
METRSKGFHMTGRRVCGKCGSELSDVGAEQLCPGCLLEAGLEASHPGSETLPLQVAGQSSSFPRSFGDYELLEEIGRGGMGVVYKARQASLDRIVAVKVLLSGRLAGPEFVQRFRTEAAAAASLQHPNIVAIHEVGYREGQHFFAMDYVAGRNLAQIARDGPLPPRRAAGYMKTITEAVQYAHERGILHRDLTPANVLIDENDQPKITDFGLAKRLEKDTELTLSGQVLGSPNYMPPEQAAARRGLVGKRSDVYSLGAVLYYLLTGRAPFAGDTVAKTLQQVENNEPVSPQLLNPSVPRDLQTVCLRCLEKEPARRYASAQELADELGRFLDRKPILARPVGRPEKAWRWCRRNPVPAALLALVALVFLAGFAGIAWEVQRAREARDVAQRRLYAAQMNQAFRAWEVGSVNVARALLDSQRPQHGSVDLRGVDWRWLWFLCQSDAKSELPTQGEWQLYAAEPSPDGRRLATAGWGKDIIIYDLESGGKLQTLTGHTRQLMGFHSLAFSPDGRRLVSASGGLLLSGGQFELLLWDLATGSNTNLDVRSSSFMAVAFSPDGRWLASACLDGTVGLWDADTHNNVAMLREHKGQAYAVVFSPDSQSLFTGGEDGTVRQWDVTTRREVGPPLEHGTPVGNLAVSPDARTLASECWENYLYLWDMTSRKARKLRYTPAERCPASPVFSPDGGLLAFSTGNNIRIWDMETEQERTVLRGSTGTIMNLRFLPDSKQLVSACEFGRPMLWDIHRPEKLITLRGFREGVRCMVVSSDNRRLIVGTGDFLDLQHPSEVLVFDLDSQKSLLPPLEHPQAVNALSLTADGKLLATGCEDGGVRVFTLPEGQLIQTLTNAVTKKRSNLVFSPDGRTLMTSTASPRQFTLWDTMTWEARCLSQDPPGGPQYFAFSPDGSLLATPMGGKMSTIIWNMPAGTTNTVIPCRTNARGATFSPDGTMLAINTFEDIELYEARSWKPLGTLKGHEHVINGIAFAPDGKILASVGNEGSVRLWSVPGCEEVAVLYDHLGGAEAVAFTSDGHWLISGARDKTVKLRRIPSFAEIAAAESSEATLREE